MIKMLNTIKNAITWTDEWGIEHLIQKSKLLPTDLCILWRITEIRNETMHELHKYKITVLKMYETKKQLILMQNKTIILQIIYFFLKRTNIYTFWMECLKKHLLSFNTS